MSIKVLVGDKAIKRDGNELKNFKFSLDVRETLGGDYIVSDHEDVDIVVMKKLNKIVLFPKEKISELTYDTQSRFFDFMVKKGIISRDSVQSGNVYASLQGLIEVPKASSQPDEDSMDPIQAALFGIAKFIETEKPRYEYHKKMDEEEEEYYTQPNAEDSTELGEVPHAREKGTIRPGIYYQSYMHNRYYRR